jgi:uncharacterized protein (TIGR03435 family)
MGYCIRLAFGLSAQRPYELIAPAWVDPPTDFLFDISGRSDLPVSSEQVRLMLQSLLKDRFKLTGHREFRDLPAYVLTNVKPSSAMHRSSEGDTKIKIGAKPHQFVFQHVSMAQLALQLGPPITSRPVIDRTGVRGSFDFTLDLDRYLSDPETGKVVASADGKVDEESAVLRGVFDQLGLSMKPGRARVEVFVIDHAEKTPLDRN